MRSLPIKIPKSNFSFLERDFRDIILEIRDGSHGFPSEPGSVRKTIVFRSLSKMHCHEVSDGDGYLAIYYYDWYDSKGNIIYKFHMHYHPDEAPEEVKKFDPFHIHRKRDALDTEGKERVENVHYRELYQILLLIREAAYIKKHDK